MNDFYRPEFYRSKNGLWLRVASRHWWGSKYELIPHLFSEMFESVYLNMKEKKNEITTRED